MRYVPSLLTVLLGAVALACGWVAVQLLVDGARDVMMGDGAGVRAGALLPLVAAFLLAGVAWQLLKSARIWFGIARRVAQPRTSGVDRRDRAP